jgi:hypothetical protein
VQAVQLCHMRAHLLILESIRLHRSIGAAPEWKFATLLSVRRHHVLQQQVGPAVKQTLLYEKFS